MADEFLRVGARGEDGKAKAIKSNNDGVLQTEIKGVQMQEEQIASDVLVTAGSTVNVVGQYTTNNTNHIRVGVVTSVNGVRFDLEVIPILSGLVVESKSHLLIENGYASPSRFISDKYELITNSFRIRVKNRSDIDSNFTIVIFKTSSPYFEEEEEEVIPSPTEIVSNLVIPANTTKNLTGVTTINDALAFSVGIKTHNAPRISLYVKPVVGGVYADLGTALLINNRVINASHALSKKYLIKSPSLAIFLKNEEDSEITVSAYLYKSNNTAETVNELNEKEYYGGTIEDRPSRHTVDVGAIYMATETQETWINTPTRWVKI